MEFPLVILLIAFAIPIFIALGMSVTNIYHVVRFGTFDARNKIFSVLFLCYIVAILVALVLYVLPVDWSTSVSIPTLQLPFSPS